LCLILYTVAEIHFFRWGGGGKASKITDKTFKFPTNLLICALFSSLLGQNFRKFVIFREGGGGGAVAPLPHQDFLHCLYIPNSEALSKLDGVNKSPCIINVKTNAVFKVGILQCITVIVLFYSQISVLLFLFLYCNFINTLYKVMASYLCFIMPL
jgi:hypothetical protein